jgi:hypothetical protein
MVVTMAIVGFLAFRLVWPGQVESPLLSGKVEDPI